MEEATATVKSMTAGTGGERGPPARQRVSAYVIGGRTSSLSWRSLLIVLPGPGYHYLGPSGDNGLYRTKGNLADSMAASAT
jgi:hypothetical protein